MNSETFVLSFHYRKFIKTILLQFLTFFSSSSGQPKIDHVDGNYRFNASHKTLEWLIPLVDSSNTSGTLEFTIPGAESNDFFPVKVNFNSKKTFCNIEVTNESFHFGFCFIKFRLPMLFRWKTTLLLSILRIQCVARMNIK